MLTPTDVHFLVGLLNKVAHPDNVEIELGSVLTDIASDSPRDVDVTIIVRNPDGTVSMFKGIEVKAHGNPLDITHVEQLCIKFADLPQIDRKVIVSASGYTQSAIKKAKYHGVELFNLRDWDNTAEGFEHVVFPPEGVLITQPALKWKVPPHITFMLSQNKPDTPIRLPQPIWDVAGNVIPDFGTEVMMIKFADEAVHQYLNKLINEQRLSETYEEAVNLSITPQENFFLKTDENEPVVIDSLLVNGILMDNTSREYLKFKILTEHGSKKPFAGCGITETNAGNLMGLAVNNENRNIDFINIAVSDRQKKKIFKQKI